MTNQQTDRPAQNCGTCKHFRPDIISRQGRCKIADRMEHELRTQPRPSALDLNVYSAWLQTYNGTHCPLWEVEKAKK